MSHGIFCSQEFVHQSDVLENKHRDIRHDTIHRKSNTCNLKLLITWHSHVNILYPIYIGHNNRNNVKLPNTCNLLQTAICMLS